MATRKEHDFIGELEIDDSKYYGVQSFRALENFKMTGRTFGDYPFFVKAFAQIKKAAAMANAELGVLDKTKADYLCKAADRIIAGEFSDQFVVDMIQGGAGTSTNMNANEVIANRANQLAGKKLVHPNDDINMSQSSNDTFPTAMHISAVIAIEDKLLPAIETLVATFKRLEAEN